MKELQSSLQHIVKSQSDVLEKLRSIENGFTATHEFLEDIELNNGLSPDEVRLFEDQLAHLKKLLKESYKLQEGTDDRVQKLIILVKVGI
jgi:predicted nuclease with TOPRIM domain